MRNDNNNGAEALGRLGTAVLVGGAALGGMILGNILREDPQELRRGAADGMRRGADAVEGGQGNGGGGGGR